MAPTPTARFGLLKPEVGKDNNQWGDTLNGTLDQIDGLLGTTGTTVVDNAVARDVLFPDPKVDTVAIVKSLGYLQRFGTPILGVNQWLPEGITRAAGPVVTANSKGIIGNGIADDAPFLAAADTAAIASGGRHELDLSGLPTKCFIGTDLTLTAAFRPNQGNARIWVAAGKTLTINGPFDPGIYGVFDPTMPGKVLYTNNSSIRDHIPQWYGVNGFGVTDDSGALLFMSNCMPDHSSAYFGMGMKMLLNYLVPIVGRTDITWWTKSWPMELTGGLRGAMFTWNGISGGIMIGFYNCSFCLVEGFHFEGGTAGCMLDFDEMMIGTTAASTAFTINQQNVDAPAGTGVGPKILASLPPNMPISIGGAGPAGAVLSTIIAAPPGDGTHGTLGVAASVSLSGRSSGAVAFGTNAGFPNAKITTRCMILRNHFMGGIGTRTTSCLGISRTGLTNLEDFLVRENNFGGNGNVFPGHVVPFIDGSALVRAQFGGPFHFAAPAGLGIVAGTNDLQGGAVDWASPGMDGVPIVIGRAGAAGAGPNNGVGIISGFVKYIGPRHLQIVSVSGGATPVNAITSAPSVGFPLAFQVDASMGIGIDIGYSQETHHEILEHNSFFSLNIGINAQGGSHHEWMSEFQDCEINKVMGNRQANPSTSHGTNCENSRIHLFIQPTARYSERGTRFAMLNVTPGGGAVSVFGSAGAIRFEDCQFENDLGDSTNNSGSAVFDLHAAAGQVIESHRNDYLITSPTTLAQTMTALGVATLPNLCVLESVHDTAPFVPSRRTFGWDPFSTAVRQHLGNVLYFGTNNQDNIPPDVDFDQFEWATFVDNSNSQHVFGLKICHGDSSKTITRLYPTGLIALVDGAIVIPDATTGDYFTLLAGGSRTIQQPSGSMVGQAIEFEITNNTGGAIVTSWSVLYQLATPWVDPPSGQKRNIRFRSIGGSNWVETSRSQFTIVNAIETATVYIDIGAGGNATPNPAGASSYRYRIAGAATINAPINAADGMNFKMEIFNNTAGPITPTLNAVFPVGYGAIAAGKSRSRIWQYDGNTSKWKPMAAVTEDY